MNRSELIAVYQTANGMLPTNTDELELRELVRKLERTRTIAIWHDHSTVLGKGYILITAKVLYDTAVCKTQSEIQEELGRTTPNLQSLIEEPEVHMLAMCTFTVEDQTALIGDRNS